MRRQTRPSGAPPVRPGTIQGSPTPLGYRSGTPSSVHPTPFLSTHPPSRDSWSGTMSTKSLIGKKRLNLRNREQGSVVSDQGSGGREKGGWSPRPFRHFRRLGRETLEPHPMYSGHEDALASTFTLQMNGRPDERSAHAGSRARRTA